MFKLSTNKVYHFKSNTRLVNKLTYSLAILLAISFSRNCLAQSKQALRYEIDAKRAEMTFTSKDALPRGREFKRLDSTYYVGWLFEGSYKFEHAADYLGYKAAATQLEKSLQLLEKDFKSELKTRTNDVMTYLKVMKFHRDWDYNAYILMQAYSNMEEPANVWKLLQKCKQIDLQDEFVSDTYNYMAWTVHRNRFYTSKKYSFLKNSIDENEAYANKFIDSATLKIKRDAVLNKVFFGPKYEIEKMPSVWHYKSILYTYQLNIESGAYYYDKLKSTPYFPANNYATFCAIQAKFNEAEHYYNASKNDDRSIDKRLNESYYYLSILNKYKGDNKKSIEELKELIKANGSTPGFGWYNLALSRNLIYDGQIEIAKRYAKRAEQFKEIHIGTTLGQSHYDFTSALTNLIIKIREIDAIKFSNKNWWYTPSDLTKIASLTIEKYGLQFLIINQFAENPERDRVIYKLFSTESTVSFDEILQLIEGFSTNYFLDRFKKEITKEKRYNVKRYYKLFVAKLLMKKGNFNEAKSYLESILNEMLIDLEYEKLFLGRVYESLSICEKQLDNQSNSIKYSLKLFSIYPQLIPFSGIKIPMRIHSNEKTMEQKSVIMGIKNANIEWTSNSNKNIPDVYINFGVKNKLPIIEYHVIQNGNNIVLPQSISYKKIEEISGDLTYAIFGIGNDDKLIEITQEKK